MTQSTSPISNSRTPQLTPTEAHSNQPTTSGIGTTPTRLQAMAEPNAAEVGFFGSIRSFGSQVFSLFMFIPSRLSLLIKNVTLSVVNFFKSLVFGNKAADEPSVESTPPTENVGEEALESAASTPERVEQETPTSAASTPEHVEQETPAPAAPTPEHVEQETPAPAAPTPEHVEQETPAPAAPTPERVEQETPPDENPINESAHSPNREEPAFVGGFERLDPEPPTVEIPAQPNANAEAQHGGLNVEESDLANLLGEAELQGEGVSLDDEEANTFEMVQSGSDEAGGVEHHDHTSTVQEEGEVEKSPPVSDSETTDLEETVDNMSLDFDGEIGDEGLKESDGEGQATPLHNVDSKEEQSDPLALSGEGEKSGSPSTGSGSFVNLSASPVDTAESVPAPGAATVPPITDDEDMEMGVGMSVLFGGDNTSASAFFPASSPVVLTTPTTTPLRDDEVTEGPLTPAEKKSFAAAARVWHGTPGKTPIPARLKEAVLDLVAELEEDGREFPTLSDADFDPSEAGEFVNSGTSFGIPGTESFGNDQSDEDAGESSSASTVRHGDGFSKVRVDGGVRPRISAELNLSTPVTARTTRSSLVPQPQQRDLANTLMRLFGTSKKKQITKNDETK